MKIKYLFLVLSLGGFTFCTSKGDSGQGKEMDSGIIAVEEIKEPEKKTPEVTIEKELLYDKHTLEDSYPYKDTTRMFQWDKIRERLVFLDSIQQGNNSWAILQNYKNKNGQAPVVKESKQNAFSRVADAFGVERYQSIPLYTPGSTNTAIRYGRDGSLVKYLGEEGTFTLVETLNFTGKWDVPTKYVKLLGDSISFTHTVFVDRKNQNIATLEKVDSKWLIRSMNPATTGAYNPPYQEETPLGIFVIQERKPQMIYLKDGSDEDGGFAPWASRFTDGAYLHGVPVNAPKTSLVEYSNTLGTIPRSHMCVRNATSHAKFIYDWAPVNKTIVFVLE